MKRTLVVVAAVALAAVAAALSARALARPDPLTQAEADGCRRNNTLIFQHQAPNWAYVNDRDTRADGPPPGPVWLEGTVSSVKRPLYPARPTGIDNPLTHMSYDFTFDVAPDAEYANLLGGSPAAHTGNFSEEIEDTARIHVEREEASFPMFAWPDRGDRVKLLGSWVWDCDHSAGGERTELHPFRALWVVRAAPTKLRSVSAEADLFVTTAATHAGAQADCAHRTKVGPEFRGCVGSAGGFHAVAGEYRFELPLPPRPPGAKRLSIRTLDLGSRVPPPIRVARAGSRIAVTFSIPQSPAPEIKKRVVAVWEPHPAPVHLRVRLERLLTRRSMDPGGGVQSSRLQQNTAAPGEWIVYWKLGSRWGRWPGVLAARDGKGFAGRQTVDVYVPRGRRWSALFVTRECDFGALGNAVGGLGTVFPCRRSAEVGNLVGDDVPGTAVRVFRSAAASVGRHVVDSRLPDSTCPPANRRGCYAVTFSVRRVR